MTNPDATQITLLLQRWREGDLAAERRLFDVLHAELRRIASRLLRPERLDHTLQPTELVHEAPTCGSPRPLATGEIARISSPSPRA